ncbi:MAG: hypothetical protein GXO64_01035 [Candidatus Micrarchaeota archaeon]|nr:hypothetical protein [Candidatus Micrarchaeota archaeon]
MAFWSTLLSQLSDGNIGFTIMLDGKDVASINVTGKKIIVEIKSPILAIEFGIKEFMKNKDAKDNSEIDMSAFENIRKAGYKVIIKYGLIEIEI